MTTLVVSMWIVIVDDDTYQIRRLFWDTQLEPSFQRQCRELFDRNPMVP